MKEIAYVFLKLGTIAFGGPAAHIAMMEDEIVTRRKWISHDEFIDMLGIVNLIPGPNSTELAILIGQRKGGKLGLMVAGSCFILPAFIIVTILAACYVRLGSLPNFDTYLYGVKPIIIVIIAHALWKLGRSVLKSTLLIGIAAIGSILNFVGVNELIVLFGAGVIVCLLKVVLTHNKNVMFSIAGLWPIFYLFAKTGAVLFGSGYVLLAFLRNDFIEQRHWLTESQLLDAVTIGQITPGPVFTTATFIGYLLHGYSGATIATIGIFLPSFIFVAISGIIIPHIRKSKTAGVFLDGVNAASLSLMLIVTLQLGKFALTDWMSITIAVAALILLIRFRINSSLLIIGGLLIGLAKTM